LLSIKHLRFRHPLLCAQEPWCGWREYAATWEPPGNSRKFSALSGLGYLTPRQFADAFSAEEKAVLQS